MILCSYAPFFWEALRPSALSKGLYAAVLNKILISWSCGFSKCDKHTKNVEVEVQN